MSGAHKVNADGLGQYAKEVSRHFWGKPSSLTATEMRFGTHGSKSVDLVDGVWHDFEKNTGGGVLDLIEHETGLSGRDAVRWLEENAFKPADEPSAPVRRKQPAKIVATYDYVAGDGALLFQVCRLHPKTFRQRRPDGNGGWSWSVKGITQVPYRLPELLARPGETVFVVEGEKDADSLARLGLLATCNAGGAGKCPPALDEYFRDRTVVILPDNDEAGRNHAALVERRLRTVAASVRVLDLPGLPDKGDVSDWLAQGGDAAQLLALLDAPANPSAKPAPLDTGGIDIRAPRLTVEQMLEDCVLIEQGTMVGRISKPQCVMTFQEFAASTASCVTSVQEGDKKTKGVATAKLWKADPERKTVHTRTFRAGAGTFCYDPEGLPALNTWRPIERTPATADIAPFLEQIDYLIANETERNAFFDWLAHIEQKPGVLPHYGWLCVSRKTGTGRNWLASVLERVWGRYVAPNVDLPALLDGQFNGAIAGKVLAIVDEVQEGGHDSHRHANRLKSLVTASQRIINPKYGKSYAEYNSCRWLVFSNHENALPLTDSDRRWRVIVTDTDPRDADTYTKLYDLLDDPAFINAIGAWLKARDIGGFRPGERPPMTEDKMLVTDAAKSMLMQNAEQVIRHWPSEVITNADAASLLSDGQTNVITPAMRRALIDTGAVQYQQGKQVKVAGRPHRCWILRDPKRWSKALPGQAAANAAVARKSGTESAADVMAYMLP